MIKFIIILIFCYLLLFIEDNIIEITKIEIKSSKIPKEFENYKILQLSDLHNKFFGKNQNNLIKKVKKLNPNIIVLTGDIFDKEDDKAAFSLITECLKIAPVYFVEGNHEVYQSNQVELYFKMLQLGVNIIDNKTIYLEINNKKIAISGIALHCYLETNESKDLLLKKMQNLEINDNIFNILLCHRPDFIKIIKDYNIDLMLSGHTHGGQWIIPFIKRGLYAPNQGIFPKYSNGIYYENKTMLIVNRGLGNPAKKLGVPIPRIFNKPEITLCILKRN